VRGCSAHVDGPAQAKLRGEAYQMPIIGTASEWMSERSLKAARRQFLETGSSWPVSRKKPRLPSVNGAISGRNSNPQIIHEIRKINSTKIDKELLFVESSGKTPKQRSRERLWQLVGLGIERTSGRERDPEQN